MRCISRRERHRSCVRLALRTAASCPVVVGAFFVDIGKTFYNARPHTLSRDTATLARVMRWLKCTAVALLFVFACTLANASTLGEDTVPEDFISSLLSRNVGEETGATRVAVEVGDPVRADADETTAAFMADADESVSNGDDSKIVDGDVGVAADAEKDAFDVVAFDALDAFVNVPRRAGPFFAMDAAWDDDVFTVSRYSFLSSYDTEPYASFPVRSSARDADETWCLLCQNFFANLSFALMISVFVVAGIYYLLMEDNDDDDDDQACRCCKRCGTIVIDAAALDELRAASALRDARACAYEPIESKPKESKKM